MLTFKLMSKFTTFLCLMCVTTLAQATIMQHTFPITGADDETGTGVFTWDNEVVADGNSLTGMSAIDNVLSISISISGSNIVGGTTTFTLADCTQVSLESTPNFTFDINFWCDNGINSIAGFGPYTASLNGGGAPTKQQLEGNKYGSKTQKSLAPGVVFFAAGVTTAAPLAASVPAPTLSEWLLILLAVMLGGIGYTAAMKTKES